MFVQATTLIRVNRRPDSLRNREPIVTGVFLPRVDVICQYPRRGIFLTRKAAGRPSRSSTGSESNQDVSPYRLGKFVFRNSSQYTESLQISCECFCSTSASPRVRLSQCTRQIFGLRAHTIIWQIRSQITRSPLLTDIVFRK